MKYRHEKDKTIQSFRIKCLIQYAEESKANKYCEELFKLYLDGEGVEQSDDSALHWLSEFAYKGIALTLLEVLIKTHLKSKKKC